MKTAQTVFTAVAIGAVLGAASYLMHSKPVVLAPVVEDTQTEAFYQADMSYWQKQAALGAVANYQRSVCFTLYNGYMSDGAGNCTKPVDCTSCVSHKGMARNAVIHDNGPSRSAKAGGPDYAQLMRQEKLVFQMSMASQASHEAGRKAYDHTVRCQRIWSASDAQCKN